MTFEDRKGRCYELAYRYVYATEGASLVHGWIGGPDAALNRLGAPALGHGWAITPTGQIYDAVLDETFNLSVFDHCFAGRAHVTYTRNEALVNALSFGNFGPWDDEFDELEEASRVVHAAWLESDDGQTMAALLTKGAQT